jgi:hypothetical protein
MIPAGPCEGEAEIAILHSADIVSAAATESRDTVSAGDDQGSYLSKPEPFGKWLLPRATVGLGGRSGERCSR